MRRCALLAVLALARGAHAAQPCELSIELHGAIVETTVREHVEPGTDATAFDWKLPAGARLLDLALRGKDGAGAAVSVPAGFRSERVTDPSVLGADPAIAIATDNGVRVVVEPVAAGRDVAVVARWTAVADIRDGELQLVLPAHPGGSCRGTIHAQVGPGASVSKIRTDATTTRGATATFTLGDTDVALAVELAFARPEPLAWVQREPLGDGAFAEAITVAAPPGASLVRMHRAVLVIDTSRSMELVGQARVGQIVHQIAEALPPGSQLEAIAFDRAPAELLGGWKLVGPNVLTALDQALALRKKGNGSDLAAAFVLAHNLVAGSNEPTLVVAITDGMLGAVDGASLAHALGDPRALDLHAVVLDPDDHISPGHGALEDAIDRLGGAYVELPADEHLRTASWLEPAWFGLAGDKLELPAQLAAGAGFVRFAVTREPQPTALTAHDEQGKVTITPHPAPAARIAQLAGARASVDGTRALVVLASEGRVARNRSAMISGGGPFTRMIAASDPPGERAPRPAAIVAARTAGLDRNMLQRLFELQLQPKAYVCYQHALAAELATSHTPKLAGTARFTLELDRGEVTHAEVNGLGSPAFDACLVDAAYALTPPLPDPGTDSDDRTLATYPLTFQMRAGDRPVVVAGDADSSSPLDIDAIPGGAAKPGPAPRVETSTPLGPLRPTRTP